MMPFFQVEPLLVDDEHGGWLVVARCGCISTTVRRFAPNQMEQAEAFCRPLNTLHAMWLDKRDELAKTSPDSPAVITGGGGQT